MSKFIVEDVGEEAAVLDPQSAQIIHSYIFNKQLRNCKLISYLLLRRHDDEGFWGKLKDAFRTWHDAYQIILYQKRVSALTSQAQAFVLHISADANSSEIFPKIVSTLYPLLRKGNLMMTKKFLKHLILPQPIEEQDLVREVVELMEKKPSIHSEWHTISKLMAKHERKQTKAAKKSSKKGRRGKRQQNQGDLTDGIKNALKLQLVPISESIAQANHDSDSNESEQIWKQFVRKIIDRVDSSDDVDDDEATGNVTVNKIDPHATSLMIAIKKGFVKSAFFSIISGSNPNYQDCTTGETALHFAVQARNELFVRLLLAFNADPGISNSAGKTPLDLAENIDNHNIVDMLKKMKASQEYTRQYFETYSQLPDTHHDGVFILTLDGGGARSFNLVRAVIAVENRMKQLQPKCKPFKTYFDYVGGTSSGAIGALMLGYTDYDSHVMQALIYRNITDVLSAGPSEREKKMECYLQETFGNDTRMADKVIKDPLKMIITGTLADRSPSKLHLMTNYGDARDGQLGPEQRRVWEAGRITSAAPLYFPSFENKFLDGGLMANNPTLDTMTEVISQGDKISCVVSLGTGIAPSTSVEDVDFFIRPDLFALPKAIKGFSSFFDHLVTQVTQSNGQEVERAKMFCQALQADYFRLSPSLIKDTNPLISNIEDIVEMLFYTQLYLLEHPKEVDDIAKCLLTKYN
jgi:calcium-independent phospholipase A2